MIKANPSRLWRKILGHYFSSSIRTSFFRCMIRGEHNVKPWRIDENNNADQIPLIIYCSHGGWWDAAIAIAISNMRLHIESYGMMEEKQLTKYRFFTKVGMFSVHRQNVRSAMESLHYAAELLQNSRKTLWIFPQGELVHQEIRPIELYNGQTTLLKKLGKAYFLPIAIRYDFLQEQKPEAFISIGKPELFTWDEGKQSQYFNRVFTERLEQEMDSLRKDILNGNMQDFSVFLQGKKSIEKSWDSIRGIE